MVTRTWMLLALLRIVWTLWAQTGYIHPDEFFQSTEIAAGDILHLDILRTWEFTDAAPVRSIVPIYLMCGLPFVILKLIASWIGPGVITSRSLITAARLTMVVFSFIVDLSAMRLARLLNASPMSDSSAVMLIIASSYVTLVFFTRTFSNSAEGFLFAAILYFCLKGSERRSKMTRKDFTKIIDKMQTPQISNSSRLSVDACIISFLLVLGIFNRPTFILFAFIPYCYWITDEIDEFPFTASHAAGVLRKVCVSATFSLIFASSFIACDSLYYDSVTFSLDGIMHDISVHGFSEFIRTRAVMTPLNFVAYNLRSNNLAEHGLHPRWLHALVNSPVLFGILPIFAALDLFRFRTWRNVLTSIVNRRRFATLFAFVFPLVALSAFPHQELRFLVPLLIPLSVLYSTKICSSPSYALRVSWVLINIVGCAFFGCLHQGGVIPAISEIQRRATDPTCSVSDVVFWRTYMPPRHLFVQHSPYDGSNLGTRNQSYLVHDIRGSSTEEMITFLSKLCNSLRTKPCEIIFISPGSVHNRLEKANNSQFSFVLNRRYWPHISTEDWPSFEGGSKFDIYRIFQELYETSSLNLYEVVYRPTLSGG